ncbi:MAG: hypothetical protein ACLSA6_15255 [Holdemania massiliensis]
MQEVLASFESESGYRIENLSMRNQNEGLGYNYPGIFTIRRPMIRRSSIFLNTTASVIGCSAALTRHDAVSTRFRPSPLREKGEIHVQTQADHYRKSLKHPPLKFSKIRMRCRWVCD